MSNDVDAQSGFRHERVSAGKAYVPHSEQRDPNKAGGAPSSPVVNQPSTAGTLASAPAITFSPAAR